MMKRLLLAMTLLMALTVAVPAATLPLAATNESVISFAGDSTFSFIAGAETSPYSFDLFNCTDCLGHIGGTFTIGAITVDGDLQSAPVTGAGTLTIEDGLGFLLTADLDLVDIFTNQAVGGTNFGATLNTDNVAYGGSEANLLALLGGATTVVSFQFVEQVSLTSLAETPRTNSFSGTIGSDDAVIPEPATMGLVGGILLGLGLMRRRFVSNS
jgi:hypothetical protein